MIQNNIVHKNCIRVNKGISEILRMMGHKILLR